MKYVKAIFENENVQALAVNNENLIHNATDHLILYNLALENYILENLNDFIIENDLAATYENIRNIVASENINFINESAIIIQSDKSEEEKIALIEGKVKDYLSNLGVKAKDLGSSALKGINRAGGYLAKEIPLKIGKLGTKRTQSGFLTNKKGDFLDTKDLIKTGKKRIGVAGSIAGLGLAGTAAATSKKD
jgi:hypothetical protein